MEGSEYDMSNAAHRALRHVEVSFDSHCPPEAFVEALRTGNASNISQAAVRLFLEEGDEQMLFDIVMQGHSTFAQLGRLSEALLPTNHPTTLFLRAPPI